VAADNIFSFYVHYVYTGPRESYLSGYCCSNRTEDSIFMSDTSSKQRSRHVASDAEFAHRVVKSTDYAVLVIAYRLAPENPYSIAIYGVENAVKWVTSNPQVFDPSHISISGFSAGANLALVASSQLIPKVNFRHDISVYPPTDLEKSYYSKVPPDPNGSLSLRGC
jgi:hypothetical protein